MSNKLRNTSDIREIRNLLSPIWVYFELFDECKSESKCSNNPFIKYNFEWCIKHCEHKATCKVTEKQKLVSTVFDLIQKEVIPKLNDIFDQ